MFSSISVVFGQASNMEDEMDPPVVFHSKVSTILQGTNIKDELTNIYMDLQRKIEDFECNGSGWVGWVIKHFICLDLGRFQLE